MSAIVKKTLDQTVEPVIKFRRAHPTLAATARVITLFLIASGILLCVSSLVIPVILAVKLKSSAYLLLIIAHFAVAAPILALSSFYHGIDEAARKKLKKQQN